MATAATAAATNATPEDSLDAHAEAAKWLARYTQEKGAPPRDTQQLVCFVKNRGGALMYSSARVALTLEPVAQASLSSELEQVGILRADVLLEVVVDFLPQSPLKRLRGTSRGFKAVIDNDDLLSGRLRGWQGAHPSFKESHIDLQNASSLVLRGLRQQRIDDALVQWHRSWESALHLRARAEEATSIFHQKEEDPHFDPLSFIKARMYASRARSESASAQNIAHRAVVTLEGLTIDVEKDGQWYPARVQARTSGRSDRSIAADLSTIDVEWIDGGMAMLVPPQRIRPPASFVAS